MADIEALRKAASKIGQTIRDASRSRSSILVASRPDSDGLATSAVLCKGVYAGGGLFTARFYNHIGTEEVGSMAAEGHDLYLICELADGREGEISEALKGKAVFIGHHHPKGEGDFESLDAFSFGFDGSKEITSTGLAYMASKELLPNPNSAAWLAILGAVGDRQDVGPKRSLLGLNELFLQDAVQSSQIEVQEDLLLFGRDVKPLHEAIANTSDPYIQGLTGHKDVCMSALVSSQIELKKSSMWRVSSDLSKEERDKLLLTLTSYLAVSGDNISSIVGNAYLLRREDEHSFLKDARDFSQLLEATARLGKGSVGLSVCLGDRGKVLSEAERMLMDYKSAILRCLKVILADEERMVSSESMVTVMADGLVNEGLAGGLANALAVVPGLREKVILCRTSIKDGLVKFSVRRGSNCAARMDVGASVEKVAMALGGEGGGHQAAAGARISSVKAAEFSEKLKKEVRS